MSIMSSSMRVSTRSKSQFGMHADSLNNNVAMQFDPLNPIENYRNGMGMQQFYSRKNGRKSSSRRVCFPSSQSCIYPIVEVADPISENDIESEEHIFNNTFDKESSMVEENRTKPQRRRVAFAEPPNKKETDNIQDMHQSITWYDAAVLSYCQSNRVMYIMRGVPGSGKSTIARRIQQLYGKKCVVICSADDFRHTKDGKYVWSQETLHLTHAKCEQKADLVCSKGAHVVIIDNTNIKFGDVLPYLRMAHKFGYSVNFISTNSDENCKVYAKRNVHQVPEEAIERMKAQYFDFLPYFYGWEISRKDTIMLKDTFRSLFRSCINISAFKIFATRHAPRGRQFDPKLVFQLYSMKAATTCSTMSHVPTCFSDKGKIRNSKNYINSSIVKSSLGGVHHLKIIGWCITMGTVFARLQLNEEQKRLWSRNDAFNGDTCEIPIEKASWLRKQRSSKSSDSSDSGTAELVRLEEDLSQVDIGNDNDWALKIANFIQNTDESYVVPDFSIGSTAHIPLGIIDGGKLNDAKKALEEIMMAELNEVSSKEWKLPQYLLRSYRDVLWVVYLRVPMYVPAMFAATYFHK